IPVILLLLFSVTMLSSISQGFMASELLWIFLGLCIFTAMHFIDLRPFFTQAWLTYGFYAVCILLLIATYLFAPNIRGNHAWLFVGPVQFQASEFAKAAIILLYAYFFSYFHQSIGSVRTVLLSVVIVAIPAALVLMEPDLGTATVMVSIWLGFLITS